MPAMHFNLCWPDGSRTRCYSPSLIIRERFELGSPYPLPEFRAQIREALLTASERVRAKFGFPCSLAMAQLAQIETLAANFNDRDAVEFESFED